MQVPRYNFEAFIDRIKDLSYAEMLRFTEQTLTRTENESHARKSGLHARQQGSLKFAEEVGEFLFFLRIGAKPFTISELNWSLYRIPVANLVQNGQMKPSALDLFKE